MLKLFKDYFHFNKRERNGVLFLVYMLVLVIGFKCWLCFYPHEVSITQDVLLLDSPLDPEEDSLHAEQMGKGGEERFSSRSNRTMVQPLAPELRNDSVVKWIASGVRPEIAIKVLHYLRKGGRFYAPKAIQRIYGIRAEEADSLERYFFKAGPISHTPKKEFNLSSLDLNSSDSAALLKLRGIGPYWAGKILRFREALGGFYEVAQLKEVYGMKDSVFLNLEKQCVLASAPYRTLDVNSSDLTELSKHPYIRKQKAMVIVNYRLKHGDYQNVEDVLKTGIFTAPEWNRVKPYLRIGK